MTKLAVTAALIHPLIAERWSPRSFDSHVSIGGQDIIAMLEAARWAPSSNNSQPWRIAVVRREDELFNAVVESLSGFNKDWAPRASVFFILGAETMDSEGRERKWAEYDTGIASALLTTQAQALKWHVHQIGGFNPDALHNVLEFNERTKLITIIAVGQLATADKLSPELHEREIAERKRIDLDEIVTYGLPTLEMSTA